MLKHNKPPPPKYVTPRPPPGLLELERFSEVSLTKWLDVSRDLDQLAAELFFSVRPEQNRLRDSIIAALQNVGGKALSLENWTRIVNFRWGLQPLACAGSMLTIGGRFNPGAELEQGTLPPFPALYLAANYETAFREKFQIASAGAVDGLTPAELALEHGSSHISVQLKGALHNVFDISVKTLEPVAAIFRKVKMPPRTLALKKKLGIRDPHHMVTNGAELYRTVLDFNWRQGPVQFGLPAQSQMLAEFIRAAGYEGIYYKSSKGPGHCLAVFPDRLQDASYIALADVGPAEVKYTVLNYESAPALSGYDQLPSQARRLLLDGTKASTGIA